MAKAKKKEKTKTKYVVSLNEEEAQALLGVLGSVSTHDALGRVTYDIFYALGYEANTNPRIHTGAPVVRGGLISFPEVKR